MKQWLIKALLSVMLLLVSLFNAASFNLPLLSISLFICRMLCCLSCSVDFLSLYVVLSFYLAASSHGNLAAHASQPMPPCGTDAGRVGWTAIDRIWVLSDSNARERVFSLSTSQNNGDADCGTTSVPIKNSSSPVEWSAFFLCFSQSRITCASLPMTCHRARVIKAELRVNI